MKSKLSKTLKIVGYVLGMIAFGGILTFGCLFGHSVSDEHQEPDEPNPRDKATVDTTYYDDSVYVITTKIDTVYASDKR